MKNGLLLRMAKKKVNSKKELSNLLYILLVILILLLSLFNIKTTRKPKNVVLGAKTEDNTIFWQNFLKKYPTYKVGWDELGRNDKVLEIDPNYYK